MWIGWIDNNGEGSKEKEHFVENTADHGVHVGNARSAHVADEKSRVVSNKSPPGKVPPGGFDAMLSEAELTFWGDQTDSARAGMQNLAEEITHSLSGLRSLRLSMDRDTNSMVVRVVDKQTGDVVQQLPTRQMVDLVKQMRDLEGVLFKASS